MIFPVPGSSLPAKGSYLDYLVERSPVHKHRGIDLVAPLGSPVLSAEPGTVVKTIHHYTVGFRGYGKVIVIHGVTGRYFLYGHLNSILVSEGSKVTSGQLIGTVGNTVFTEDDPESRMRGKSHLHFEISATPYPMSSEEERLDPRPELVAARRGEPVQPTKEPKKAANRLRRMEISDKATIAISLAILGVIWLLTLLRK